MLQGHKRAPSDVSVASSEDEKIPLSPSSLDSVPEKLEHIRTTPTGLPVANHVMESGSEEELAAPAAPAAPGTPVNHEEAETKLTTPESETEPEPPSKEMQQLQLNVEDEKEVDTAETPQEENTPIKKETDTPAEDGQPFKHLKVTLTLPEEDQLVLKQDAKDKPAAVEDKKETEKMKNEKDRDSDSGSCSTSDYSSVDLNLSISSFLSKTKEPGSISVQVSQDVLPEPNTEP